MQRYSIVVTGVNGELMHDAFGCDNQLWLGNTSARAFVRNVSSIEFLEMSEEPTVPTASESLNQPNVALTSGVVEE